MASAQTEGNSPRTSGSSGAFQTYLQQKQALVQQWETLVAQGATQQQLDAWRQQNATRFQALQQSAQALSQASALQPMREIETTNIPANASATLQNYLTTQASLANARAFIYNNLLQALPAGASQTQVDAMKQQADQAFQQQYAADLQLQAGRRRAMAANSRAHPVPIPPVPSIPHNATPQLRALLAARYALFADEAALWNQNLTASPADRQAAMARWRQQNASQLQQLTQLAQTLTSSSATVERQTP